MACLATSKAIALLISRISDSAGSSGPLPSWTMGAPLASALEAAISMPSVTREARAAITPRPIPGKI